MLRPQNRVILSVRIVLIVAAIVTISSLVRACTVQLRTTNVSQFAFEPRHASNNSYVEIRLLQQHPTDEIFDGELFLYYPEHQNPPTQITITRSGLGRFGSSIIESSLVVRGKGKAFPGLRRIGLPTPGISHRRFPFDSPHFEVKLNFNPPIRPTFVRFVNRTDAFLPLSET